MTAPAYDGPPCIATGCTRQQAPDALLCPSDVQKLGEWISRIDTEFAQLDATPSMQGREPGSGGSGGLASQRSVGDVTVMSVRDRRRGTGRIGADDADDWGLDDTPSLLGTLESWARLVRDERGLTPPTVALAYRRQAAPLGPVCDLNAPPCDHHTCWSWTFRTTVYAPATVLSERRVLATHLAWIVQQDWCDELYADIRQLWGLLRGRNAPQPYTARRQCACGGSIRWVDGGAQCGSCGTRTVGLDVIRRHSEGAVA